MIDFNVISKIFLIFVVLQIILFFKVWVMTDNVAKIRKTIEKGISAEEDAKLAMLNGQVKLAKTLLDRRFYELKNSQQTGEPIIVETSRRQIDELCKLYELYELPKPE